MTYLPADQLTILPLSCHYFNSYVFKYHPLSYTENGRTVNQFEIDIITKGTANLTVDGVLHSYQKGDICFRKPGQNNRQDYDSPYECIYFYFRVLKKNTGEELLPSSPYNFFILDLPTVFPAEHCKEIKEPIFRLYQHFFFHSEYDNLASNAMISVLMAQLYKISMAKQPQTLVKHHPAIRKSIDYIQGHLSCPLGMEDIAKQCGLSTKYFQKIFKESTGKTPNSFILEQRMSLAKTRLLSTDDSIEEVAYDCGFNSSAYFTSVFKQMYQQTPREFRNKIM